MRKICALMLAAMLGFASPLFTTGVANAQEVSSQSDSGISPEFIGLGALGAGVLAAAVVLIVLENHHHNNYQPQVSP